MVRLTRPLEDADLALMNGAGGHLMAVLWNGDADRAAVDVADGDAELAPADLRLEPPFDVVAYAGPVTVGGYEQLCELIEGRKQSDRVVVVLETAGGDPHAAFRIARALGSHYKTVHALVPRYCKSAGTLIVLGAHVLHLDDQSELGPLDVQVRRDDELDSHGSGLEYLEALDLLHAQQLAAFNGALGHLADRGLSTTLSSKIVATLVNGLLWPIAAQVDPHRLVEMHRAMSIAQAYGGRLAEHGGNLQQGALADLIGGYPSHSFVIDRKEARVLFRDVRAAQGVVKRLSRQSRDWMPQAARGSSPVLSFQLFPFNLEECIDVLQPDRDHGVCAAEAAGDRGELSADVSAPVRTGAGPQSAPGDSS